MCSEWRFLWSLQWESLVCFSLGLLCTKDHGTWSSKHRLGMRRVSLLVIKNFSGRMFLSFSRYEPRRWFIFPLFFLFHLEQDGEIQVLHLIRTVYINELVWAFGNLLDFSFCLSGSSAWNVLCVALFLLWFCFLLKQQFEILEMCLFAFLR